MNSFRGLASNKSASTDRGNMTSLKLALFMGVALLAVWVGYCVARIVQGKQEGFEANIDAYKSSKGYKSQASAVTTLADSRSNGRRDIVDMLASSVAPPGPEQCFVNFYSLGCRFTGYLGPFDRGYYDVELAVTSALKMGCRTFLLEIDYLDDCVDRGDAASYFPRLVVRDINDRFRGLRDSSLPMCKTAATSDIRRAATALRNVAFSSMVANPNDPLVIVLFLQRLPPVQRGNNKRLLTYLSNIAKGLQPLLDRAVDNLGTGGTFTRQQQESLLLTNNITDYQGRVLFFCNTDTTGFRDASPAYPPNEDLDYIVNLQLSYKQQQLGCTSRTGGSFGILDTVDGYMQLPLNQVDPMCEDTKLRWTVCLSSDPAVPVDAKTYAGVATDIGVHCIPIQIWDKGADFMFQPDTFKTWSFIPKPKELRFRRPPTVVPAEQSPAANANGGALRAPQ
jgi:hypothetical protein